MPITHPITADKPTLRMGVGIAYAMPNISAVWLFAPINIIQAIYAKHYGFSLSTIAAIILLVRIFDAVIDPVVGFFSDYYYEKKGSRKPFVVIGLSMLLVSCYFLYSPAEGVAEVYLLIWMALFYASFTLYEVPHSAWGGEISSLAVDKTKIYSLRSMAGYVGLIFFYSVPLYPIFDTTEITPETLVFSVTISGVLIFPFLFFCLRYVPVGYKKNTRFPKRPFIVRELYAVIFSNRPLVVLLVCYLFSGIGSGMWYGLIYIYIDSYLGLGDDFSKAFLIAFCAGFISSACWYRLSLILGKKNSMTLSCVFLMLSYFLTGILNPLDKTIFLIILIK